MCCERTRKSEKSINRHSEILVGVLNVNYKCPDSPEQLSLVALSKLVVQKSTHDSSYSFEFFLHLIQEYSVRVDHYAIPNHFTTGWSVKSFLIHMHAKTPNPNHSFLWVATKLTHAWAKNTSHLSL